MLEAGLCTLSSALAFASLYVFGRQRFLILRIAELFSVSAATLPTMTYRLLGSLSEAEDAVQETYARWFKVAA